MFQIKTNQKITIGNDSTSPIIIFRVSAINVFDKIDLKNTSSIYIYSFFLKEFPSLKLDKLVTINIFNFIKIFVSFFSFRVFLHDLQKDDFGPRE